MSQTPEHDERDAGRRHCRSAAAFCSVLSVATSGSRRSGKVATPRLYHHRVANGRHHRPTLAYQMNGSRYAHMWPGVHPQSLSELDLEVSVRTGAASPTLSSLGALRNLRKLSVYMKLSGYAGGRPFPEGLLVLTSLRSLVLRTTPNIDFGSLPDQVHDLLITVNRPCARMPRRGPIHGHMSATLTSS